MDFTSSKSLSDLKNAIAFSERQLEGFRKNRIEVLREYAGHHYSNGSAPDNVPINLIELYVQIYQRQVSVNDPRSLITSPYPQLAASSAEFKLAVNQQLERMVVDTPLNEAGMEALFMLGCVEVGIDESGEPFVEPVLFDDLIVDMSAKSWRQVGFVGHRFRASAEWVHSNESFDKEMRQKVAPSELFSDRSFDGGSSDADTQSQTVTFGGTRKVEEYKPRVELCQLYLPEEGILLTFADGDPKKALRRVKWKGPQSYHKDQTRIGPYHFLRYIDVPGNLMPVGPAQLWRDIHDVINRLANKVFRQAERQKTLLTGANPDDIAQIVQHGDGDSCVVTEPDKVTEKTTGGANQVSLGMVMWLRNLGSYVAGNADLIGGTAATTDTVGQDQILMQSAGQQVKAMQQRMLAFSRNVLSDVAWWMWTDPLSEMDVSRKIPGTEESIMFQWTRERRRGEFAQYRFEIEPYSVQHRTPQERLQSVFGVLDKLITQYGPLLQASQMSFDMEKIVKLIADYSNTPEIASVIVYQNGEQHANPGQGGGGGGSPGAGAMADLPSKAPVTKRIEERRSGGANGGGLGGMEAAMMSKMMSSQGAGVGGPA